MMLLRPGQIILFLPGRSWTVLPVKQGVWIRMGIGPRCLAFGDSLTSQNPRGILGAARSPTLTGSPRIPCAECGNSGG